MVNNRHESYPDFASSVNKIQSCSQMVIARKSMTSKEF